MPSRYCPHGVNVPIREVPEELIHTEVRQILAPDEVILHLIRVVRVVRVACGLRKVIVAALDAVFVRDNKVWVQISDVLGAADDMEA